MILTCLCSKRFYKQIPCKCYLHILNYPYLFQVFGLHPNADITYQTKTTSDVLETIVNIQPKDSAGGSGETRESLVARQATEMLDKLPADYVPFEVSHFTSTTTYLVLSCARSCVSFFTAFSISFVFSLQVASA